MNTQHLRTFLWLRWHLFYNQMRRAGALNAVLALLLTGLAVALGLVLFIVFFFVGMFGLKESSPQVLLILWDVLVLAFLFCWAIGTLIELQRADVLTLDKFMHLPVSPRGAFLINYLSSLLSLSLAVFLPAMLALGLGLIISRGPMLVLALPALAAFLLMVTALTYQFQGWLAALMANKRRRRTVLVVVTMVFFLLCQIPNLVNYFGPWRSNKDDPAAQREQEQLEELKRSLDKGDISSTSYDRRRQEITKDYLEQQQQQNERIERQVQETAGYANLAFPPGWLPLGVAAAARGIVWPPLLATLGMGLIGSFSLWRSYRTTLRLYTGDFNSRPRPATVAAAPSPTAVPANGPAPNLLLERKLPLVSEYAAAVALGTLRSLLRAPEIKIAVLSQFIVLAFAGSWVLSRSSFHPGEYLRPLMATGPMSMVLLLMLQMVGNQFGLDRNGFRAYVLSAAPRREILLGKNLATAPLAGALAIFVIVLVELVLPMRLDHFLALLPQTLTMFLLFCIVANWLSILAPMRLRPGSLKAARVGGLAALLHFAFVFVLPVILGVALLPLGCEFALEHWAGVEHVPIYLALSLAEAVVVVFVYRLMLELQGSVFQSREVKILQTVAVKDD